MISLSFYKCLVCGKDVLNHSYSDTLAMCATHSKEDKLEALANLETCIKLTREEINEESAKLT